MKIRFYGKLSEKIGAEIEVDPPAGTDTVVKLRKVLADIFPQAAGDLRERSSACIADAIVGDSHAITETDMVEFFPPLSGG